MTLFEKFVDVRTGFVSDEFATKHVCMSSTKESICPRKEKQLYFTKAVKKIADIPSYVLAVSLAGVVKDLTPQSLFRTGGELFEAR